MPDLADRPVYADMDSDEAPRRAPRLGIAIAAVVIAASVAGVWYVYDRGVRRGDLRAPPVIAADTAPIKTSPADPGGLQVPNQSDELSNRRPGRTEGKVEQLLPPPERPSKEAAALGPPPAPSAASSGATVPIPPPVATAPPAPTLPPVPTIVEVAPRQAMPPQAAAAGAPAARIEPKPEAKVEPKAEARAEPKPEPRAEPKAEIKVPPATAVTSPAGAPPAAVAPKAPSPAAIAPAAGKVGGFRIQLAATPDRPAADAEWRRISRANADVLGNLTPAVAAVDLPGKGIWHRLSAGPFNDRAAAVQACETLKQRKVGCFVVAP